ncbi:bleomycin resistance protein [Nocardia testacea]|uniref:bleomycin resistance protein n=1 Tax=Nocardia testacea TaxID=248551 RepID=UPI0033DDFB85
MIDFLPSSSLAPIRAAVQRQRSLVRHALATPIEWVWQHDIMSSAVNEPALVPELLVTDTSRSIEFWCGLCGFEIKYQRAEEGFAYLSSGNAHIMLEQRGIGRNWITAQLDRPFGRGINFQITVPDLASILSSLHEANYPLFMPPETKRYRIGGGEEVEVHQFLVTDPDGYLIRFRTRERPGTEK